MSLEKSEQMSAVNFDTSPLGEASPIKEQEDKRRRELLKLLRSWTLRCPQCKQAWLVMFGQRAEIQTCKWCGCKFSVKDNLIQGG
jgi:rRNA maturation endonuclease Nob1